MEIKIENKPKYRRHTKPYIWIPVLVFLISLFFNNNFKFNETSTYISACLTFAGFLLTAISILIVLPNSNMINILRKSMFFKDLQKVFFICITVFIMLTVFFMYNGPHKIGISIFLANVSETLYLTYCLASIGKEIYK